jgi:hypothetical protein
MHTNMLFNTLPELQNMADEVSFKAGDYVSHAMVNNYTTTKNRMLNQLKELLTPCDASKNGGRSGNSVLNKVIDTMLKVQVTLFQYVLHPNHACPVL